MSNYTNDYDKTNEDTYDNYFIYFILALVIIMYLIPHILKKSKEICPQPQSDNEYISDEEIQMEENERTLKPDYDSDDEEENKYI